MSRKLGAPQPIDGAVIRTTSFWIRGLHILLKHESWAVNWTKLYRIYPKEGLTDSDARPIVHSDCGGPYRLPGTYRRSEARSLVSRKASSQDNAACEGLFGRLKTEFFFPRDWRAFTVAQSIDEVDAYFHWHNETRIKMSLVGRIPVEYRKSLGLMP